MNKQEILTALKMLETSELTAMIDNPQLLADFANKLEIPFSVESSRELLEMINHELGKRDTAIEIEDDPTFSAPLLKIASTEGKTYIIEDNEESPPDSGWKVFATVVLMITITASFLFGMAWFEAKNLNEELIDEYYIEFIRTKELRKDLKSANDYIGKLESTLDDVQNKMALLLAFKESGFDTESIEDIRELIELAEDIPYGSPFVGGHIITEEYGVRDERWFAGDGIHKGIDIIPSQWETPPIVHATSNGTIIDFGVDDIKGKYILFENDSQTYRILYGHLSKIYWQKDKKVRDIPLTKGTKLGIMGETGLTRGAHLHMEIYVKDDTDWKLLNPKEIINYVGN